MANLNEERVLSLDDGAPNAVVVIDGLRYPVNTLEDFTIVRSARLQRIGKDLQAFGRKESPTEEEAQNADDMVDEAVSLILPTLEKEKLKQLKQRQKAAIVNHFFNEARVAMAKTTAPSSEKALPASSPSSSASTAEVSGNGPEHHAG